MGQPAKEKICGICGDDCSQRPRTRDPKGRYFCQDCYDAAVARATRQAKQTASLTASVEQDGTTPEKEPDSFGLLNDLIDQNAAAEAPAVQLCPACRTPVSPGDALCTSCGHSLLGGSHVTTEVKKAPRERREGDRGLGAMLLHPIAVALAYLAVNAVIIAGAFVFPPLLALFFLLQLVYAILSMILAIWILIEAFRESLGTGLLTMCVPFYVIYFVFYQCDSIWIRYLFAVHLLVQVGSFLAQLGLVAATQP